jgi:aminoglycoside phosphotransferase (APT) family kinase protein
MRRATVPEYDVGINFSGFTADDCVAEWEDVRPGARPPLVVLGPLGRWLDGAGLGDGHVHVERIGDGHSNVTCRIERHDLRAVLRRPPRPPLPPSAHDVLREARVVGALHRDLPVPRILAVCDDPTVTGAPFYVMEELEGDVIAGAVPAALDTPGERAGIGCQVAERLAEVHAVAWREGELRDLGRPEGYLERQIRRFGGLWGQTGRDLPAMDRVGARLATRCPASARHTLVHGDYRLGNLMFAAGPPARVVGILDWELCTIGDPLADLGYLCAVWTEPGDAPRTLDLNAVTRAAGFPTRAELIERYARASGLDGLESVGWYEALALWKAAVLMENNHQRARAGHSDDPFALSYGAVVAELAERAAALVGVSTGR